MNKKNNWWKSKRLCNRSGNRANEIDVPRSKKKEINVNKRTRVIKSVGNTFPLHYFASWVDPPR